MCRMSTRPDFESGKAWQEIENVEGRTQLKTFRKWMSVDDFEVRRFHLRGYKW